MPSAYEGTDIISCLQSKYIIRQCRISYRVSDISLFLQEFELIRKNGKNIFFVAHSQTRKIRTIFSEVGKGFGFFVYL